MAFEALEQSRHGTSSTGYYLLTLNDGRGLMFVYQEIRNTCDSFIYVTIYCQQETIWKCWKEPKVGSYRVLK